MGAVRGAGCLLTVLVLLTACPTLAQADFAGQASVIDGDTLEIHGRRVRLHGIDAPEAAQLCQNRDGKDYRCGQQAALALADLIDRRPVACEQRDIDRYGRIVAVCTVAGTDVGAWLMAQGLALAYRKYSTAYVEQEAAARAARIGIWRGSFVAPWEWRKGQGQRQAANDNAAAECQIKGNISASGERIYHVPGGAHYDRTRIDPSKGERWFCTEAEARAAGWRKARR